MRAIAFIFARGGSKGLPGKNIRMLEGKPLIAWSIEHAKKISRIERTIVSTDSEEIAAVARQYGADVPFIRPANLADDHCPEWLAWQHALNYVQQTEGILPDAMVSIPTTGPLRHPEDIEKCLDEYAFGGADAIVTVTDAHRSPWFNMVTKNEDGSVGLVIPSVSSVARRQDVPPAYDLTTVAYVADPNFVLSATSLFSGCVRAVHVPIERAIDIDTELDLQIAEFLFKRKQRNQLVNDYKISKS